MKNALRVAHTVRSQVELGIFRYFGAHSYRVGNSGDGTTLFSNVKISYR